MAKEVVLIAVHGMGDTSPDFADDFEERIAGRVGKGEWGKVYFDKVFYQDILQDNQRRVFNAMRKRELDWVRLRKFMLFGFSDAAGTERRAAEKGMPYHEVQKAIRSVLERAYQFIGGPKPVVIIAQSLGAQVISNYIWDAQQANPSRGTWKHDPKPADKKLERFLRLKDMRFLYTTGCNIPIFLAGFPKDDIVAVETSKKGYAFRWKNYYDQDDVLGWPLQPLSPSYKDAIHQDKEVNAGGGFLGTITGSWNPFSHSSYWKDSEVLKPLARDIRALLP